MNPVIYLDNSATTKPCEKSIQYINDSLTQNWGNPSSLHMLGISAENLLSDARFKCARSINADESEIFFTGSGTEANNIAILGAVKKLKKRGNRIVTTAIEHPSVMETINSLEADGFEIIRLQPDSHGIISKEDIIAAIDDRTILVSIMLVNNELGSIQPVEVASQAIIKSASPALLHCDAVQAFGKLPIDVKKMGVDLLSVSGHKIHGPKGIGFLYKKKNLKLPSTVFGGGQEGGIRSGTQPMPAIAGLLGAVEELPDLNKQLLSMQEIWDYAFARLSETGLVTVNSAIGSLPYILNISLNGYKSETVLHFLESKNIFVSSGSACAKGKRSYVLESIGLSPNRIDSAIRLSFSRHNTKDDIDKLCAALMQATKFLRKAY